MNKCNLIEKSVDKENVKQWYICQIEDARDALNQEIMTNGQEIDLEEVNRKLQILNDEKKRRGYR